MKAIICTKYGSPDVLELREVDRPSPGPNEIRVKVKATTVTSGDCRVRGFEPPMLLWLPMRLVLGIRRPRQAILGVELSGVIDAIGKRVTRFRPGDEVFALSGMKFGANAEYAILPENGVVALKPANAAFEEAAALPFGGTTALYFLRKGKLRSGGNVLVYGASGAVGAAAVQLAKIGGANVTAVCSAANAEWVRELGADRVVDYAKEDFASGDVRYDLIFDAVGKTSRSACGKALAEGGAYVSVVGQGMAKELSKDMETLKELFEAGRLKAVIDRRYSLEQVPDAHRYVETGRKKGNVVVSVP